MRVGIASDHAGFDLKERLKEVLEERGVTALDFGPETPEATDYPDWARKVALAVASGKLDRGILICGTGIGMAMAANRVRGVRAAACHDLYTARMARAHNDANILALGARVVAEPHALAILETFLETAFEGGRHQRRVEKLDAEER
jgi:ribose 5-phosphate isomerase B